MHFVVELFFDEATEAAIRATRRTLTAAGAPGVPGCRARPHVSVAVYEQLDVAHFVAELAAFAAESPALEITLPGCGMFSGDECVVFLAPLATEELLALHRAFHQRFAGFGRAQPYYQPGSWVPHCTLAAGFPPSLLPMVDDLCREVVRPLRGRLASIGLAEYPPRREHGAFALGMVGGEVHA